MLREGEGAVVRQGRSIAVVVAFLIGCAVVLMAGASGVRAEASKKARGSSPKATASEEARCEGTRTYRDKFDMIVYTTNDLPGCPKGGLLLGTDSADSLDGKDGDDKIRGLGGSDEIFDGSGDDVIYGGDGDDWMFPDEGNDVIYGGDGNDMLASNDGDGQGDKLYCGAGKDRYHLDPNDYVDGSCEVASAPPRSFSGHDVITSSASVTSSASASPVPIPQSGGPAILLPAAALLLGSGIVTYAILRRR
jgi:Ca2+-binding RTX toxin-like protein